jgi:hypothetical protein
LAKYLRYINIFNNKTDVEHWVDILAKRRWEAARIRDFAKIMHEPFEALRYLRSKWISKRRTLVVSAWSVFEELCCESPEVNIQMSKETEEASWMVEILNKSCRGVLCRRTYVLDYLRSI